MDFSTQRPHPSPSSSVMSRTLPSTLSPATTRLNTSVSNSSLAVPSGSSPHSGTAVTIDAALAPHLNAQNPPQAALESILAERNTLSSQNAQLWKLIEKQRSAYGQMLKELERIRAERDLYKSKLHPMPSSEHRRLKGSSSTSHMHARDVEKDQSSPEFPSPGPSMTNGNPRAGMVRHKSDDPTTPRKATLSVESSSRGQAVTPSRSHDQSRSNSSSMHSSTSSLGTPSGGSRNPPPVVNQNQANSHHPSPINVAVAAVNGSRVTGSPLSTSPPPLEGTPGLQQTVARPAAPAELPILTTIKPLNVIHKSANSSPATTTVPLNPFTSPTATTTGSNGNSIPSHTHASHTSSGSVISLPPMGNTTGLALPDFSRKDLSRESRITLPDEARRYIANMGDSPLPSPQLGSQIPVPARVEESSNGRPHPLSAVSEEGQYSSAKTSPQPFLDLDDDESENDTRHSEDTSHGERSVGAESDSDGTDVDEPKRNNAGSSNGGSGSSRPQQQKLRKAPATADQFPLPPATFAGRSPTTPTTPTNPAHVTNPSWSSSINMTPTPSTATSITVVGPNGTATAGSSNGHTGSSGPTPARPLRDSFLTPLWDPPAATFRQMPLLDTDLKNATAQVIGSHIRANDKGKEVLSFVISVGVIGKDGWTIEKFYSDVLALDSRLRQRCSRNTVKKIAPLPDNKLFKDHAPAKVDQRKKILQTYLQSIIDLPIKDKNEIIVFFSSDVMRERTPVTQNGYKEGYLTKRGKNFGGWKTRYFVLQGPVLEYYESRGGTHLGSIVITGAQIGRQQKGGDKRGDADDENEYRHAFLIIEAKKGPAGAHPRHVLCAESDEERDSWVEVLVRYVMGTYNDDPGTAVLQFGSSGGGPYQNGSSQASMSSSSLPSYEAARRYPSRGSSKEDFAKTPTAPTNPIPISKLSLDSGTSKFFQAAPLPDEMSASSPAKSSLGPSPIDRPPGSTVPFSDSQTAKKLLERGQNSSPNSDEPLSSSLPSSSPLDNVGRQSVEQRANSELGHYPDLLEHQAAGRSSADQRRGKKERLRASYHPTLGTVKSSPTTDRPRTPEPTSSSSNPPSSAVKADSNDKVKISGPLSGAPIPAGYKFGAKDTPPEASSSSSNERDRKAKSRTFWGFGRQNDKTAAHPPSFTPRAVFGVPLQESLAVAQIANLPAIAFRCIQYLEAKKADQEEGIYRLNGSSAVIKSLKDRFNAEGDVDLLASDEFWDPNAIAGLLKSFLRELPTSILTRDLHMRFLGVIDFVDAQERVKELSELVSQLPLANYSLLRALTAHLILIVQNSNVNKMTVRNVGIVFSPTLGIPAGVFSLMLGEFNRVFNVDGDGVDSAAEEEPAADDSSHHRLSGLSRRNSRQYTDAAADQLLGLSGRKLPTTDEGQSDDGEGDEISIHEESGTEGDTEATHSSTVESSADSGGASPSSGAYGDYLHPHNPPQSATSEVTVTSPKTSRASNVAASRGLNINVAAERRRSRLTIGLPTSPRPIHRSESQTPTSEVPSPVHTPK
ncbi:RhoGAP-domain-containing protein [Rickenella mellea]|uniref:RhoGAP-domain-containing protein n=1 Tax=Rickenella mellea TaxID=50990 RepID=A0A4Y7Q8Y5_9AGAM|nr:RhoGAP-domain-containing protein [Rickenella mellea]